MRSVRPSIQGDSVPFAGAQTVERKATDSTAKIMRARIRKVMKENRSERRSKTEECRTGCWDMEPGQKVWELGSQKKQQRQVNNFM